MNDDNPYAPPVDEPLTGQDGEIAAVSQDALAAIVRPWRNGDILVMPHNAVLPRRCICCNSSDNFSYRRRTLATYNVPVIVVVALLTGPVIAYFVARSLRKEAKVVLGLCDGCRKRQAGRSTSGLLMTMAGILWTFLGCILPVMLFSNGLFQIAGAFAGLLSGLALMIAGIIYGMRHREVVTTLFIDPHTVWLGRVSPEYLAQFNRGQEA